MIHISPSVHSKIQFQEELKPIKWLNFLAEGNSITEAMQNSEQFVNTFKDIFKEFQENVIAYFMHDIHEAQLVTGNSVSDKIDCNVIPQSSNHQSVITTD